MRYSYEFKLLCVDLYKSGIYPDTPNGTTDERFKKNVREWARMVDSNGPEVLKHKVFNKVWSPEEKLALVSQVIAGKSRTDVALKAGINPGMLYQWVQKYKTIGYNGLVENRKGRPPQISDMKHAYYRNALQEHGIIQSMSRKGNCYDNCIMETFFGRLKNEMYYGYEKDYSSFEEFSKAVEEYIDYYNNRRIQAKTKWMPPVQYRIASMCSA